eukprot:TRINITY_DN8477_c0_g1_i4.p1 TRINITY_DN8477_c0_g1~~TRINITY_DN8477_c0_g1_i4.p1  ORF type:complete len:632 (+),score=163.13 TRINITY_DN8477_c0_g1_i4:25-1920(+)
MASATSVPALCSFSEDGLLFAIVASDGLLRVWDVAKNDIRIEQKADLNDPISSIAWECSESSETKKRKKRKQAKVDRLAYGTVHGQVSIFSCSTGESRPCSQPHSGKVNSIAWSSDNQSIFTVSADKQCMHRSIAADKLLHKWAADKRNVTAVALGPVVQTGDEEHVPTIVTAGAQIRVWNMNTYEEIRKLSGHSSAISCIAPLPTTPAQLLSFVQHQHDDPNVSLWNVSGADKGKRPHRNLALTSNAMHVHTAVAPKEAEGNVRVLTVTKQGTAHVFELTSDSERSSKPLQPVSTISLTTGDVPSENVPILCARFAKSRGDDVLIAHGSVAAPVFETLALAGDREGSLQDAVTLTRSAPIKLLSASASASTSAPVKSSDVVMMGAADASKVKSSKTNTIGEQVASLLESKDEAYTRSGQPRSGTLSSMLAQALQSDDNSLLDECLQVRVQSIVEASVAKLESKHVVSFLQIIVGKLEAKPSRALMLMVWIRSIFKYHFALLATQSDAASLLGPLYNMVEARTAALPRLLKLQGRLQLMLAQGKQAQPEEVEISFEPKSVYIEDGEVDEEEEDNDDDDDEINEDGDDDDDVWNADDDEDLFQDELGQSEFEDDDDDMEDEDDDDMDDEDDE